MTVVELVEHLPCEVALSGATARRLAALPRAKVDVRPATQDGRWILHPSSTVGVVTVDDLQLLIRPKVGIQNLLALMDVTTSRERWGHDLFNYADEPDLLTAMVRVFVRTLDRALVQGLRRDYRAETDRLLAVRGRIDMQRMVRRPGPITPVPCSFDEYTSDINLNRLLLAAVERARRVQGLPAGDRRALQRHRERFDGVRLMGDPLAWVKSWTPTRLDRHYEPAVRVAEVLLRNLSLGDRVGDRTATTFLLDMNELVETFIGHHLGRLLRSDLRVSTQHRMTMDVGGRVQIRPDLVLFDGRRPVFVADVKYKAVASAEAAATSDLYQLSTYASVLRLPQAALITCSSGPQAGGSTSPPVVVRHLGTELEVWPLDLTVDPSKIHDGLAVLARRLRAIAFAGRCRRPEPVSLPS